MSNAQLNQELIEKYNLLDTPNEVKFDQITQQIAEKTGCRASAIAIVTSKRVWFKSRYGLLSDEESIHQSLARELVFSQRPHLIVENFSRDDRYRLHYYHTILSYEFFAAVPILLENHTRIGAICVFDFSPKKITPDKIYLLEQYANLASTFFQTGKNILRSLHTSPQTKESNIIKMTSNVGDFGGFHVDTKENKLDWNILNNRIFNLKPDWVPQFNDIVNPDFTKHLRANDGVYNIFKDIQVLISNQDISQYSHLYTLNFGLPMIMHINMIYHRNGNDIYVVFKNESRFLDLAKKDSIKKTFLQEIESISKVGGWEFEVSTKRVQFSVNAIRILNIPAAQSPIDSLPLKARIPNFSVLKNRIWTTIQSAEEYVGDHSYYNGPINAGKTLRIKCKPIFENNHLQRIVGTIQDVTEDKAKLDLLSIVKTSTEKQVDFYKTLVNNNNILIFQLNNKGELLYSNEPFKIYFGESKEVSTLFRNDKEEKHPNDNLSKIREVISQCLQSPGKSFPLTIELPHTSGKNSITTWDCCTIGNTFSEVPDILLIGMDITQIEENKVNLLKLVDKVTLQNERSLEFANIINHHVRSQVANFQGLLQLMELMNSPTEKMEYFSHLKTTAKNLLEITDIVSSVLYYQNKTQLALEDVNIEKLCDTIISNFWRDLISLPIAIDLQIPTGFSVRTVEKYLYEILEELIRNAIKFKKHNAKLTISIEAKKKEKSSILIVRDNGRGINMELYKDRLFKLYDTLTYSQQHRGIGLYMVRVKVSALGGTISAESKLNEGTTFFIELPDAND
ncbi:GAF domain-containing sensor histidine kinase [Algoriphagus vanfongensis]|uniref:GAF domain-containing sensor histidine kinase n=1 Tax=Algoriphagus vanfongensis TaxID=426371 RepID=UPI0004243D3A|nr:GAF domain-containing sensor histidine kinase [Algoriphagus vanfongensis]